MTVRILAFTTFVGNMLLGWILMLILGPGSRANPPLALLATLPFGLLATLVGWLAGSTVNAILVFPKQRIPNFVKGFIGAGVVCLALWGWFVHASGKEKLREHVSDNETKLLQPVNGQDDTRVDLSLRSFQALEKTFGDPDSIELIYHFAVGPADSVYSFYYMYRLFGFDDNYWYARVDALGDSSVVRVRNGDALNDTVFLDLTRAARIRQKGRMDTALQEIQGLPDSVMSPEVKELLRKQADGVMPDN